MIDKFSISYSKSKNAINMISAIDSKIIMDGIDTALIGSMIVGTTTVSIIKHRDF